MLFNFKSKKIIFAILILLSILIFYAFWNVVSGGYDRQNKAILFLKKIIPNKISRKVRDTIFVIPDLKERNKQLSLQVEKYEQSFDGKLFNKKIYISDNKQKYALKEFFLPFHRLDIRLGWAATENSLRAHYLEIVKDKVLVISGKGQTLYFEKKNIFKDKLSQKDIPNNISNLLMKNKYKLIGIRDLFVEDDKVYISIQHKDENGFTINLYESDLNFEKLIFKPFFKINEYWPVYNVYSGGRIETFKDNKILFSIGYSDVKNAAQDKKSFLGKIIAVDKTTKNYEIISIGNRNPQGLFYAKNRNLVINTEHGPKGGDEINFNYLENKEIPNFGWDIASYGTTYSGKKIYKDSHAKFGFVEPFKYFTPSIGISEIVYLPGTQTLDKKETLFVSSLRAASVYIIKMNDEMNKIISEDRLYFPEQRLRHIEHDKENNVFFIMFENTPSIGILEVKP